jgi:hypothetical protein
MALAIRTQGGFCNRLRAIVCASLWAEDLGLDLEIYWPQEIGHMACGIEEILDVATIPRLTKTRAQYLSSAHQVLNADDMRTVLTLAGDPRIQSYSIFHDEFLKPRGLAILRGIQVMPYLESIATSQMTFTHPIGIHIRRTDHLNCIQASPLPAFEVKVGALLEENPDQKFFLASDEINVKNKFKEMYAGSISSPIYTLGRMTKEQQQHGIVDWLLLHKCSKILASRGSSFSELAALRAGIVLEVV